MNSRLACSALLLGALLGTVGCKLPGKPSPSDIVRRPTDILDPVVLFSENCAGCHGADGKKGPAPPIGEPVYLAIVDDNALRDTISKGRPGTAMSAFAQSEGGMLTNEQINAIISGMRQRWGQPQILQGVTAPPYAASAPGNAQPGSAAYGTFCASCHGADGKGTAQVGSIVERNYLTLISNQGLRTNVIVHRPDFNTPDWRNYVAGHPMSDQEISDVVAWLAAQRPTDVSTPTSASAPPASPAPARAATSSPGGLH